MTVEQLKALQLGYLTGADLMRFAAASLLISRYNMDNECLQDGASNATSELLKKLKTKYDLLTEFQKRGADRETDAVRIAAIFAVRIIFSNLENIGDQMKDNFRWADQCVRDIRNGQMNLLLNQAEKPQVASVATLVSNSFSTLG